LVESLTGHQSWRALVDRILVVDCPVQTQIDRVMARNGLPRAQVEAIIARQATREARLAAADDVIDNGGTLADLAPQIARLDQAYRAT
jgi:dephospho-CoA kinase